MSTAVQQLVVILAPLLTMRERRGARSSFFYHLVLAPNEPRLSPPTPCKKCLGFEISLSWIQIPAAPVCSGAGYSPTLGFSLIFSFPLVLSLVSYAYRGLCVEALRLALQAKVSSAKWLGQHQLLF